MKQRQPGPLVPPHLSTGIIPGPLPAQNRAAGSSRDYNQMPPRAAMETDNQG